MNDVPNVVERGPHLPLQRHFIDGSFCESRDDSTFETLNPATNEVLADVASGGAADVDVAVQAARRAFDTGPWPKMTAAERAAVLRRIASILRERAQEFIQLEVLDIGMPITQMKALAARTADNFEYYAGVVTELHGRSFQVGDSFINYTVRKPAGVLAAIMPWNAPLMLSSWRIAPALAAGNTIVLKPAEWSPLSSTLLAEVLEQAGLPRGVFNVVHGFGETAGAPLSAHPGVDLVSFTGEPSTGSKIVAAGAPTLKRTSLELGGKSPVVVFEDADAALAVDAALAQIFSMNGQRCTAGSRLLVQRSLYDEIVEAVADRAKRIRVGDPFDPRTELGPLIRPEHLDRVLDYVESARTEGARVLVGGGRPSEPSAGELPRGDGDRRRGFVDDGVPGGDLRTGARGDALRARGRRRSSRQRHALRPRRLRLDQRHPTGAPSRSCHRHGDVLDQLTERARSANSLRWRKAIRDRSRGWRLRIRLLLRDRGRPGRTRHARDPPVRAALIRAAARSIPPPTTGEFTWLSSSTPPRRSRR